MREANGISACTAVVQTQRRAQPAENERSTKLFSTSGVLCEGREGRCDYVPMNKIVSQALAGLDGIRVGMFPGKGKGKAPEAFRGMFPRFVPVFSLRRCENIPSNALTGLLALSSGGTSGVRGKAFATLLNSRINLTAA